MFSHVLAFEAAAGIQAWEKTMDGLIRYLRGEFSAPERVWTALLPALLIGGYFVFTFLIYLARYIFRGSYRDAEFEARGSSFLANMWFRLYFVWTMRPFWFLVVRTGIPPNALTTLSLFLALAGGVGLAAGRFALGGWLYIASGILDTFDGRLARQLGSASHRGAALDSILDRYADAAILVGLAWYYRDTWVLMPCLLALTGSLLVPYIRARGEASGISIKEVGLMQRAERILYLGVGCAMAPVVEVWFSPDDARPIHRLAVIGIVLLAVATQLTALQRFAYLLRALSDPRPMVSVIGQFTRMIVANVVATAGDFAVVVIVVEQTPVSPPVATLVGALAGAVVNFSLNRLWAFKNKAARLPQMWRYAFVSSTAALLSSGGVAVLLLLPNIDYRIAWFLVRTAVSATWNYPLYRDYVFVESSEDVSQPSPVA